MTTDFTVDSASQASGHHTRELTDTFEFRLIHALAFSTFLVLGTVWYMMTLGFLHRGDNAPASPVSAARTAADSSVPFVFQRH